MNDLKRIEQLYPNVMLKDKRNILKELRLIKKSKINKDRGIENHIKRIKRLLEKTERSIEEKQARFLNQ